VRDDVRAYLVGHLGSPDGVLVVDESGLVHGWLQRQLALRMAVALSHAACPSASGPGADKIAARFFSSETCEADGGYRRAASLRRG
jgi:hypothetical protein